MVQGVELETSFRPQGVPGLNLRASAAINNAKYRDYIGDCYAGQTAALGCNLALNTVSGLFTAQNLSGRQLRKAPSFAATFGGYYEFPVTSGLMMSLSSDLAYSSGYNVGTQPSRRMYASRYYDAASRGGTIRGTAGSTRRGRTTTGRASDTGVTSASGLRIRGGAGDARGS